MKLPIFNVINLKNERMTVAPNTCGQLHLELFEFQI